MIALKTLLSALNRPEVTEVALRSGKAPALHFEGGGAEPTSDGRVAPDDMVQLLFSAGGSRYVESLSAKPTQWRTRVEGVGPVIVVATQNGEVIEARFMLRDPATGLPPGATAPRGADLRAALRAPPAEQPRKRAPSIPPKAGKSVRPPRDTSAPASRRGSAVRKQGIRGLPPGAEIASPRDENAIETPPAPRRELPTLPSGGVEVELDITPSGIPSVPGPILTEDRGPLSPRTLPEARFSRDSAPEVPPQRPPPITLEDGSQPGTAGRATAPRRVEEPPQPRLTPSAGMTSPPSTAALSEPFAMPLRAPDPSPAYQPSPTPPPHRPGTGRTTRPFARDPHTPVFRKMLRHARDIGASDLHLVAGRPAIHRVAGQVLPEGDPLEAGLVEDVLLSRVPSRLAATLDRDGSCDFAWDEPELGRFRVNVCRHRGGYKGSLRLIAPTVPTLAALGLPEAIAGATRHHQGLIVITGPTGHGKTTTMAALVDVLNRETTRHIITVEDPIEYLHPRRAAMMSQREVGTHTRSFHTALKAALREDPDVIVVGELRDTETVRMAIAAGETGHLVIGTMSTPSAARTIDRLIDLFPPGDQAQVRTSLAGGLRLIVSQRLLPDADGKRMVAAAEVLPGMVPLWNLIRDSRTYQIPSLQQRGRSLGVIRLDDSLADLVRAGRTTAAAAVAVAEAPEELEMALGARAAGAPGAAPSAGRATSPLRPPEPRGSEPGQTGPGKGGFFERAGALFGGKKGS